MDFEGLLNDLDRQLSDAKAAAATRARREEAERTLRTVRNRIESLRQRIAEFEKLRMDPPPVALEAMHGLLAEQQSLQEFLAPPKSAAPAQPSFLQSGPIPPSVIERRRREAEEHAADDARILEEHRSKAQALFDELSEHIVEPGYLDDSERLRHARHLVRLIATHLPSRDSLAMLCGPYRLALGDEFAFLWNDEKEEEPVDERVELTNRDVAARILRRMVSKGCIGGAYAPFDMIYKGFRPHDQGRAKAAVELLVKCGVFIAQKGGKTAAIDPGMVHAVRAFVDGAPLGVVPVDDWCGQ